jgi:hypothetical protein
MTNNITLPMEEQNEAQIKTIQTCLVCKHHKAQHDDELGLCLGPLGSGCICYKFKAEPRHFSMT